MTSAFDSGYLSSLCNQLKDTHVAVKRLEDGVTFKTVNNHGVEKNDLILRGAVGNLSLSDIFAPTHVKKIEKAIYVNTLFDAAKHAGVDTFFRYDMYDYFKIHGKKLFYDCYEAATKKHGMDPISLVKVFCIDNLHMPYDYKNNEVIKAIIGDKPERVTLSHKKLLKNKYAFYLVENYIVKGIALEVRDFLYSNGF